MMESTAAGQARRVAVAPGAAAALAKQLPTVAKLCPREQTGKMLTRHVGFHHSFCFWLV